MAHQTVGLGTVFNMFKVDSGPIVDRTRKNPIYYWFLCECGTRKKIRMTDVKSGRTVSCGCKQYRKPYHCNRCGTEDPEKFTSNMKSECRKCNAKRKMKQVNASPRLRALRNKAARKSHQKNARNFLVQLLVQSKRSATKKTMEIDIDIDFLINLWDKQDGLCAMTGIKMVHARNNLRSISIDRIDSSKGYIRGNIQLVCKSANLGKGAHQNDEYLEYLEEARITRLRVV